MSIVPYGWPDRLPAATKRQLTYINHRGLTGAAGVRAIEFVTHIGLQAVAEIGDHETRLLAQSPVSEARLKLIADTAAGAIASEIARMGL
jgi:hypothetical protein